MTPERLFEIKRECEWHLSQPAASVTACRLSRHGLELLLALEDALETIQVLRTPPVGTGGCE